MSGYGACREGFHKAVFQEAEGFRASRESGSSVQDPPEALKGKECGRVPRNTRSLVRSIRKAPP